MGFVDITEFDFIDKPPTHSLQNAIKELQLYQAIEGTNGPITEIGKQVCLYFSKPIDVCKRESTSNFFKSRWPHFLWSPIWLKC